MNIPFLTEYLGYLRVLYAASGVRIIWLLLASLVVAITDGVGITMLLPLLQSTGIESDDESADGLVNVLDTLGIPLEFKWLIVVIGFIFLIKAGLKFMEGLISARITSNLLTEWRRRLLTGYRNLRYQYYTSKNTGHFTNVINEQINGAALFTQIWAQFSSRVITALVYLALAMILNFEFTVMAIAAGLIVLFSMRGITKRTKLISAQNSEESGKLNKILIQILQSYKYLKGSNRFGHLEREVIRSIERLRLFRFKAGVYTSIMTSIQEPVAVLFMLGIMAYQVEVNQQPVEAILVTLVLFYRSMNALMISQGQWQSTLNWSGGLKMVMNEFKEIDENQNSTGGNPLSTFNDEIEFQHCSFAFEDSRRVLDSVNLRIRKNETVAIVGGSGAGKTTLTDLLTLLFDPVDGKILIDGLDTQEIDKTSWQSMIGLVTQDTVIFDDTVENNITLWEDHPDSDALLQKVIRSAHSIEFIRNLPKGLSTKIGERGVKLSGGQKQRLAIARELYKEPAVLILDEATSALDSASERFIQQSLEELKGQITLVIIAHRLSTVRHADNIVVMDEGKIIEQGSYDDLVGRDSRFRRLVELQKL